MKREQVLWPMELRVAEDSDGLTVEGRAIPYMEVTDATPHGKELFEPGALSRSVGHWQKSQRRLKVFRNHDHDRAVGHVVDFVDTDDGLDVTVRLADTGHGRAVAEEVAAGLLDSMSIGFRAVRDRVVGGVRHVTEAALHELSLVPMPAYGGALVTAVRRAEDPIVLPPAPDIPRHLLRNPDRFR